MADREVTAVRRDTHGRTIALANPGESWSPVPVAHAIAEIESGLYDYHTSRGGRLAAVHVIHGQQGTYLRTSSDATRRDNLDDLPLDTSLNSLTGAFDVMLQLSQETLAVALRAMHASGALTHRAGVVTGTHVAVLVLGTQEVLIDGATPGSARVRMPYQCWVRPVAALDDPGDCATGVIEGPVACYTMVEGDGTVSLATDWSALRAANVTVEGAATATVRDAVRAAVVAWARSSGGRFRVPPDTFGNAQAIGLRFAVSTGGLGCVQVGIDVDDRSGVDFPAPSEHDLQLAVSGHWVVRGVIDALEGALGALPPPHGSTEVAIGGGAVLTALDVEMADSGLVIRGSLQLVTASASFTVPVSLVGATPQSMRAVVGDVEVDVHDVVSQIGDFFSGGLVRRALAAGVRAAIEGSAGAGMSSLLERTTLRSAAALGSAASVRLDARMTQLSVSRHGVVLSGSLTRGAAPAIQAALSVSELAGRWRQLTALESWAPGDSIVSVSYDFGDGQRETLAGEDVALAVPHEYAPGRWKPSVTIVDAAGRSRLASAPSIRVP